MKPHSATDGERTNETYEIVVTSPLLRPGMTIRTTVSSRYVVQTAKALVDKVREINK